ncbi:MAG: 30S ribosomal protein S18 [bacterium]
MSRRVCKLCAAAIDNVDYKDVELLKRFMSPFARIVSRRRTGLCAKHQRQVTCAIKRARFLALLPFISH